MVLVGRGYLAFILALNVVMRVYLLRDLWVRVAGIDQVDGIDAAANVAAKGESGQCARRGFCRWTGCRGFLVA